MSKLYVIGVGGTGTKCVETFVHLCAMGFVEDPSQVEIRIVDIDEGGGNFERLKSVMGSYAAAREVVTLEKEQKEWFHPELSFGQNSLWSTRVQDDYGANDTLDQRMERAFLNEGERLLLRALYGQRERSMDLGVGVRGLPRIGSLLCAQNMDLSKDVFWQELFGEIAMGEIQTHGARILLVGSLFGGTGASCTPTIARTLSEWGDNRKISLKIGMCLMLPYFQFQGTLTNQEVRARADHFIINTKAALRYYKDINILGIVDALYLLGDDIVPERSVRFATGKSQQKNEAMPVELVAGAAIVNFLYGSGNDPQIKYVKRNSTEDEVADGYRWGQFPEGEKIRRQMDQLLRFALAFNRHFYRIALQGGDQVKANACFNNFFGASTFDNRATREEWQTIMRPVQEYCDYFVSWARQLKGTGMGMIDPNDLLPKDNLEEYKGDMSALAGRADNGLTRAVKWNYVFSCVNKFNPSSNELNRHGDFLNKIFGICKL